MLKIGRRTIAITSSIAAVTAAATFTAGTASATPAPPLAGTWTASPVSGATSGSCPAGPGGLSNQTVRNIVYPSVSGDTVRVRLSNVFGTSPVTIGAAALGVEATGANVVPGTNTPLTFGGSSSVTVPPGAEVLSDPVSFAVSAQHDLAVSVYVPQFSGPATYHPLAVQTSYLSTSGDFTGATADAAYTRTISCWMFADGIDVVPSPQVAGSVVAFGDSITDGYASTVSANHRWPNDLARRFDALNGRTMSVVDEGISGNRVLSDAGTAGVSALARFSRDVLQQPGAKDVIVLEGINDIGQSDLGTTPYVSADDLISAYKQMITQAHAAGLKIFGATLTPFEGAFYWSPAGGATREAVNHWILTSGAFDGTIDFASAVADPANPEMFDPAYDSGDHLHPNDAGYQAMANAINLKMLLHS